MARRFRFRLETVRRLRQRAQDTQRRVVADAARAVGRIEKRVDQLMRRLQGAVGEMREVQDTRRLDMVSLRGHQFYRTWLNRRISESHGEVAEEQARLDLERVKLGEASKRLKVIETLRDRQWERHRTEAAREEQATADEAAVQMYLRRQKQKGREVGA